MVYRKRTGMLPQEKAQVIVAIREAGPRIGQVHIKYDFGSPEYVAASDMWAAARRLAILLSGDERILDPAPFTSSGTVIATGLPVHQVPLVGEVD